MNHSKDVDQGFKTTYPEKKLVCYLAELNIQSLRSSMMLQTSLVAEPVKTLTNAHCDRLIVGRFTLRRNLRVSLALTRPRNC